MAKESPPSEASLDDVKVRISEAYRNPNIGKIQQVTLKEGPRAFRIATLMEIKDPRTGKLHHYSLKIDSIDRRKNGWFSKPERSIRLEGHDPDEIERLYRFLTAHAEGKLSRTGDLHVIGTEDYEKLEGLLDQIPSLASPDMVELVKLILPRIENAHTYLGEFIQTFEDSDPQTVADIAIASRMVQYKRAHENLVELVQAETLSEPLFQKLLEENPWMFGSEYSELLDRRVWTRDDALDFMLRRTSDDFLEVIEIKTPFSDALLLYDKSHDSYYPSSKLSPVLGQVMRYIEELERSRDSILSKDGLDTLKIRARVIIGRDGDKRCQEALRNLNAHLHRVEIITFDQLVRIADRVLHVFRAESEVKTPAVHGEGCDEEEVSLKDH